MPNVTSADKKSSGSEEGLNPIQIVNAVLYSIVLLGLIVSVVLSGINLKTQADTAELISSTKDLAQELRQSSDDLTRFIRTFTVTDNATYWDHFLRVLDIRDGKSPLPTPPVRNYWDLSLPFGVDPLPMGQPRSLLERVRDAKFTDEEIALLDEAKANSDALVDIEEIAYHAMIGLYRPTNTTGLTDAQAKQFTVAGPKNQALAQQLTHGMDYHIEKARIMKPIDEFAARSTERILQRLREQNQQGVIILAFLSVMLLILIFLVLFYIFKVVKDAQTQEILNAMLPSRVAKTLTVSHFNELRNVAAEHSNTRRKSKALDEGSVTLSVSSTSERFPVLFSEFIPIGWVAFTDVVGFTNMCRTTNSERVIAMLNELFSLMDIEALNFGIDKIKTIGDAFMAAKLPGIEVSGGGAPAASSRGAESADSAGLEMIKFLFRVIDLSCSVRKPSECVAALDRSVSPTPAGDDDATGRVDQLAASIDATPHLEIRVGLNVGPLSSGIVGFERPLFDLFGDTVNTAARLEASGVPGSIHVLESALPNLGKYVGTMRINKKGKGHRTVNLKGIGEVRTVLIEDCTHRLAGGGDTASSYGNNNSTRQSTKDQIVPFVVTPKSAHSAQSSQGKKNTTTNADDEQQQEMSTAAHRSDTKYATTGAFSPNDENETNCNDDLPGATSH